jgi:chorismate-pyruvate lyase
MQRSRYWRPAPVPPSAVTVAGPVSALVAEPPLLLTRFQRMLVGTDGTVTHMLAAYADEPIDVQKLLQVRDTSGDVPHLRLPPEADILRRRVVLRGRRSGQTLLYAEAVVVLDRVDPAFVEGLVGTDKPIGILLAESRTETFREILEVKREPAGVVGAHFGTAATDELISRTYRIVANREPIILITEKFPAEAFRGLPA